MMPVEVVFKMRYCSVHHVLCVVTTALFVGIASGQCLTKQQFSSYKDNHQYSVANVRKDWSNPTGGHLNLKTGYLFSLHRNA